MNGTRFVQISGNNAKQNSKQILMGKHLINDVFSRIHGRDETNFVGKSSTEAINKYTISWYTNDLRVIEKKVRTILPKYRLNHPKS